VGRAKDWWPFSDTDPVPGDPQALAALGNQTANVAYEIEQMAKLLPPLASGDIWDSEAGDAFRQKAQGVATLLGKARNRFQVVATALGKTTYGGYAYAATLQSCQDTADTAITAVVGPDGSERGGCGPGTSCRTLSPRSSTPRSRRTTRGSRPVLPRSPWCRRRALALTPS
jgi:hypothetical protein